MIADPLLIASVKRTQRADRYITFWRSACAGYAWPLPWCGLYTESQALEIADAPDVAEPHQFAVPLKAIEGLMVTPRKGDVDGDAGPVLRNTPAHWAVIRAHNALLFATSAPDFEERAREQIQAARS